jgi:hypothetical protein
MSYRAPWATYAAGPLVASLIPVLICTAASAQRLYSRGSAFSENAASGPNYGNRPTWLPGQQGPVLSQDAPGGGLRGGSPWPSWRQGPAPIYANPQPWPIWQQAPTQSGIGAGNRGSDSAASWPPPRPSLAPSAELRSGAGDGGRSTRHPKPRVTHVHVVPPVLRVAPLPAPPPQILAPSSDPPIVVPPDPQQPPPRQAAAPPPGLPEPVIATSAMVSEGLANHPGLQPRSPVSSLAQIVSRISTILGAVGALALALPLARLLVKALRRRWRRNRRQGPARVVLVGDQGRTRMIETGGATAAPVIELRLLTSMPVSTLRLAA